MSIAALRKRVERLERPEHMRQPRVKLPVLPPEFEQLKARVSAGQGTAEDWAKWDEMTAEMARQWHKVPITLNSGEAEERKRLAIIIWIVDFTRPDHIKYDFGKPTIGGLTIADLDEIWGSED